MKKSSIGILRNSKQIKANAVPTIFRGITRGASALGTEALSSTLVKLISKKRPGKLSQIVAPGLFAIGLAAEVLVQNQYISAVGQGMSSEAIREIGHNYIPASVKSKMNLSGLATYLSERMTTQEDITNANNEMIAQELRNRGGNSSGKADTDSLNGLKT